MMGRFRIAIAFERGVTRRILPTEDEIFGEGRQSKLDPESCQKPPEDGDIIRKIRFIEEVNTRILLRVPIDSSSSSSRVRARLFPIRNE